MKILLIFSMFGLLFTPGIFSNESWGQEFDSDFSYEYPNDLRESIELIKRTIEDKGPTRVIIELKFPSSVEYDLNNPERVEQLKTAISELLVQTLSEFREKGVRDSAIESSHSFTLLPILIMDVDTNDLGILASFESIRFITEDVAEPPLLKDSIPIIGATLAWTNGYSGQNQTIAILDSGVDGTHSFLVGKVVSQACFSSTQGSKSTTLCSNGLESEIGGNSGINCDTAIPGCDHGTHVAGIAAGDEFFSGLDKFSGVAKDAKIITIQVFSEFNEASDCLGSAPCILSYRSDQIKAMERVFDLRNDFDISSVNLSLGGGHYPDECDNDPRKTVIDNLRSVGIATIVASGNNGHTNGIATPACISSAISVGSTKNNDDISSFSNSAEILDLLAPGDSIRSSVPDEGFEFKGGTSMAAPHVAGAWAVMKSKAPNATVSEVFQILNDTGIDVTDPRNGITVKRIQLDTAVFTIPEFPLVSIILTVALFSMIVLFVKNKSKLIFRPI